MKKLIINQRAGPYDPSFGGEYKNIATGEVLLLTHPQASTLRIMRDQKTVKDQFDVYCFAYMVPMFIWLAKKENTRAFDMYAEYTNRFGHPWSGNAKHVLPPIEMYSDPSLLKKDGLDIAPLKENFAKYSNYEFTLYN